MRSLSLAILSCLAALAVSKEFVCYWESWSRYRADPYKHSADKIPINFCTFVIYSFAGLNASNWRIKALDVWWDIQAGGFNQLVALKKRNPKLKVSLAVGGWNEGVVNYSNMVADPAKRRTFISSVVDWVKTYGFDGFDLDWEYPGDTARGGSVDDKQNLNKFLEEMRAALDTIGGKKYLTTAVPALVDQIRPGFDVPVVAKYCDFIHVMTYDLKGSWDGITGNHVSLYSSAADQGNHAQRNVAQGMKNWFDLGAPKSKLIMGIAFYGKSFTLQRPDNNGLRVPVSGEGGPGTVSQANGTLFYYEICERLNRGYTRRFDDEGKVPYAYNGNQWVGYEDVEGITYKMEVINQEGYGGAMTWAIDLDDHADVCGGGAYPLSNAVVKGLGGGGQGAVTTPTTKPTTPFTKAPGPSSKADCSSGATFLPHDKYCNKFFMCAHGVPTEFSCPAGLVYDPSVSMCNWKTSVLSPVPFGCTEGKN